ncbi:putative deoxyribonuclease TATDN2 isoform X2 [Dendropsophus ebraccatus]|uniref:putative deoxyribonuclease TATDN2 isoform X2 n=1 Tax=Dendropsophus ebraccatus TaxID=150705 RepID=UPI0038310E7D
MADRSESGSRKHKWQSPPEESPSKYLRSSESRRVSHSRDRDGESPSPSQDRRVTYYPRESTPKRRLDIGAGVRSTVRARIRQTDGLQTHGADALKETAKKGLEKEHDHREERNNEPDSRSSNAIQRPRTSNLGMPSLLFQRAFSDILGTPCRPRRSLDSVTRRSPERKKVEKRSHSDPKVSPLTPLTSRSTSSEKKVVKDGKQRSEDVKRSPSPRRIIANVTPIRKANVPQNKPRLVFLDKDSQRDVDRKTRCSTEGKKVEKSNCDPKELPHTLLTLKSISSQKEAAKDGKQRSEDVKTTPSPRSIVSVVTQSQKVDVVKKKNRLVFLDEDSDEDATADLVDKDPSIGSDFSDIEDVEPLARFSQDSEVSPCCSLQDDSKTSTYQYESPWKKHYTEQSLSSPMYRPPAEHNTWRQKEQDNTYMSEISLLNSSILSVSSIESPIGKSRKRTNSFDASWSTDHTTKSVRRSLDIPPFKSKDSKFQDDGFIDTHCHLDMLFARLSHRSSFADLREQYTSTFPQEFHGCITDYCDPRTLQRLPWQQVLDEDLVWGAFGCHPHFAQYYNNHLHEDMMMALRHPKAIAFGEMGLDYSHKCSTNIPDQMMTLLHWQVRRHRAFSK